MKLPIDMHDRAEMLFQATDSQLNLIEMALYFGLAHRELIGKNVENLFNELIQLVMKKNLL